MALRTVQHLSTRPRTALWFVTASAVLCVCFSSVPFAQQPQFFRIDPNNPLDHKAVLGLTRAARAAQVGTQQIRLLTNNEFNASYHGQGVFVAGKPILNLPQWAVDAVMGHEMGHMVYRHVETKMQVSQGLIQGLSALGALLDKGHPDDGAQAGAVAGEIADLLFMPKFTQGEELQADAYGVQVLRATGYQQPGNVMANALALIERSVGPNGGGFFDTHPSFERRIERLRGQ